jgi:uroporphyrin-III C-methyltransferase
VTTAVSTRTQQVLLVVAHGSSSDARARERVVSHVAQIAARVPHDDVRVAFVRGAPSVADALRDLRLPGGTPTTVTVVPFTTAAGYYATSVLPDALRQAVDRRRTRLLITPPVGGSARIARILHRRALRVAARHGWAVTDTAVLIAGHGTTRHSASRDTALAHARALAARGWASAQAAFIDDTPAIADALAALAARRVIVLPFLVGGATHAGEDIPHALGLSAADDDAAQHGRVDGRHIALDAPLGVDDSLSDIAADLAIRAWPRATAAPKRRLRTDGAVATGVVHLVGAGPGAADLLTVRARRLLREADVIVHDRLVSTGTLALARPGAKLIDVGKWPETPQSVQTAINERLVAEAQAGHRVVRLKGGDPFVFGRGSEELDACRAAGVRVTVVPGISSALAAPAVAGIAVTARHISRGFAVVTAATATDDAALAEHVRDYARIDTLVVLMGRARLAAVCRQLMSAGRDAATPVACIERATLPGERVVRGTLATIAVLADAAHLDSPMVTVIGATAAE